MIPPGESLGEKSRAVRSAPSFAALSPSQRINAVLAVRCPHDDRFLSQFIEREVRLHSFARTSPKTCTAVFRFRVSRFYANPMGNLHGGAQSLIYDILTSLALQGIGSEGHWLNSGVSRSLAVTYLRPAPVGTEVDCEVEVTSAGKTMALLRGVMKTVEGGKLISTCEHDKAAVIEKTPAKL